MITEDYVSFETAKLLKEKGFNEKAKSYFTDDGLEGYMFGTGQKSNSELEDCFYSRPTLQMAMKWLREVHNLFIGIEYVNIAGLGFVYQATMGKFGDDYIDYMYCLRKKSYEEACEAAIKYYLENFDF